MNRAEETVIARGTEIDTDTGRHGKAQEEDEQDIGLARRII